jgi:hypothetical protein
MAASGLQNIVLRTLGNDPRTALVIRRLCYRPTIFFRLLSLIALSFPHGKIRRACPKYNFIFFYFSQIMLAWKCFSLGIPLLTVTVSVRSDPHGHVTEVTHVTVPLCMRLSNFRHTAALFPHRCFTDCSLTRWSLRKGIVQCVRKVAVHF